MNLKFPKPIYQFVLALLVTTFTLTACGGGDDKKKEQPADTAVPAPPVKDSVTPPVADTPKGKVDSLIQKPTAPGD
jgi:PBP1b-binding outer membrane lipoprotein LpoB